MRSVQAPKGHLGSGKALHLMVNDLTPHFEDVQAHYDLSD
ncbi:SAM-dependent methyltransferase, partial [Mycobacterium tuberculosis]|nr:SAM-dependent methyltransferase [Mycobacterium tuberculosis]